VVRTDEDSVRAIRNLGCRPEEDLCARSDSDTGSRILGQKGRKNPMQLALPERPPGMADEVVIAGGGSHWHLHWSDEELLAPLPPAP